MIQSMPEGVMTASGQVIDGPAFDDRNKKPGENYTWDRHEGRWREKKKAGRPPKGKPEPERGSAPSSDSEPERDRDPDPGWFRDSWEPKKGLKFEDIPESIKADIAGVGGLVGIPILSFIQQVDPYCGGALAQQWQPIIDACLPLICRSERIVRYFSGDSDLMIWLGLGLALKPVAQAIYTHHIARAVETYTDEHGMRRWRPRVSDQGDHLVPPVQPEYDYSA